MRQVRYGAGGFDSEAPESNITDTSGLVNSAPVAYDLAERRCREGVVVDDMSRPGAWTANNGGTVAADTTDPIHPQSIKITAPVSSYTQVAAYLAADLSQGNFLSFKLKRLDSNFSRVAVGVSLGDSTFTARAEHNMWASGYPSDEWVTLTLSPAATTLAGTAEVADLSDVRYIRFEVHAGDGGPAEVLLSDIRFHRNPLDPGVVIIFDDGHDSVYDEAFAYMEPLGIIGTTSVTSSFVGTAGHMTLAQLQEMEAAGWECASHSNDGSGLAGASASSLRSKLNTAYDYLVDNGLGAGRSMFVYPGGSWDATVLQEVRRLHSAARTAGGQNFATPWVGNRYLIPAWYFTNTVTLADATAAVDRLIARGGLAVMTFHDIVATTSATEDWPIADFRALMDYIVTSGLRCYRPTDVLTQRT